MDRKTKSYESEDGSPRRGSDPSNSAEDQALVNLITQTAKKSSYNNSKKDLVKDETPAPPPPKRSGCCGSASDVAKPPAQEDEERGVLKDPQSSASYDVLGMVGEGGFSKVVLVRARAGHGANGEVYAAKIIPKAHLKSAGASFVRATMLERNILGEFDHPLLLRLYHSFQERDKLVLVVAYCPGGSLHTHVNISLKEDGRGFDEHRAAFYVAEIAQAIAHLHSHGIVHRDLKLENVLVHASGHVAVSDFGASKRLAPRPLKDCRAGNQDVPERLPDKTRVAMGLRPVQTEPPAPLLTQTKSIVGTPAYMAPEMLLAQPYDFAVDWWALGVLFFTMLKGRLPFDAAEEDKMLWRIVKSKPRYDPGWRKDTLEVLRALLQKRPATRLCTLRDVGNMSLYKDYDWAKLEKCELRPPFVPRLRNDEDRTYVPRRVAAQEVPEKPLAYTKGDSMRKLFRKFSHRSTVSRASTDDSSKGPN